MPPGVVHCPDDSVSAPPSSGRGNHVRAQSQPSFHLASSSPSARCPSTCFDFVNEESNVRVNVTVVDGHADVCESAVMIKDKMTVPMTVILMTFSLTSSALHPGSQLLSTLISLLVSSTSQTASHVLHYSLHSFPSHLPSPLLLLLLLLGSPSEIQEFSLS